MRRLRADDLERLHVPLRKVLPFVVLADHRPARRRRRPRRSRASARRQPPLQARAVLMQAAQRLQRARSAGETDLAGFRARGARRCWPQARAAATSVRLGAPAGSAAHDLFAAAAPRAQPTAARRQPSAAAGAVACRPAFVALCRDASSCTATRTRFALLYRLLWRLLHEPALRARPARRRHAAGARSMAQAVRRDIHKMKAFVRFRPVPTTRRSGEPLHVAWFEPEHHIVEADRAVLRAPLRQHALGDPHARALRALGRRAAARSAPARERDDAPPADAGEALWLTYYRSIFNPARLKLAMMQQGDAAQVLAQPARGAADRAAGRAGARNAAARMIEQRAPARRGTPAAAIAR